MRAVSKKLLQSEDSSCSEVVTSQEANKLAEEMQLEMQLQLKVLKEQVLQQQQLLVAAGNLSFRHYTERPHNSLSFACNLSFHLYIEGNLSFHH